MTEELRVQYGIFRQFGMTMQGPGYVQIVAGTFPSKEEAQRAAARIPRLRGVPVIIRKRKATDWEDIDE